MSSNDLDEKINTLLENDDTENFYSLICEIIEENKEYSSDLNNNLNEVFKLISNNLNESNQEIKLPFICLFFEILIQENLDFSFYLQKTFQIINQNEIYSDENIKRIINICSNATIKKKDLFDILISFSKNKIEYLYIIFSLAGFKDIILDNVSDNWELIIELLDNPEIKSNSNSIKNILKCLELLINLSAEKFRPFASSALYQALDYLTETDTELQKRSLMIIYSLTKYCDEQLQPLSENIIDFLKVLQNGNNIEINNLCNTMLKHFMGENIEENENEEIINENENENENNDRSNGNNNENEYDNENENENYNNNNKIDEKNENENEQNFKNSQKFEDNNDENKQDNENENEDGDGEGEGEGEMEEDHLEMHKNYVKEERQEKDDEEEEQKYIPKYEKKENKYENEGFNSNKKYNYKDEDKNVNDENNEENEINEEDEENKYNYKKRNMNIKEENNNERERINKKDNINNDNNLNNIDINAIIKKIKDLSDKQIIILDSIEQYKRDTKRIINQKKLTIQSLDEKIEELQEKIRIEKNKKRNKQGKTNYQMKRKNINNDYDDEDDKYNYRY